MKPGPEIDPRAPEYIEFSERLTRRLELFHGREMTEALCKEVDAAVERIRTNSKLPLPKLTAVVLRDKGIIDVVRADLDRKAVTDLGVYYTVKYDASQPDVLWALVRSFPHYFTRN